MIWINHEGETEKETGFIILFREIVRMDTTKMCKTSSLFLLHRFIIPQLSYNYYNFLLLL
jgi:hypothetical protein